MHIIKPRIYQASPEKNGITLTTSRLARVAYIAMNPGSLNHVRHEVGLHIVIDMQKYFEKVKTNKGLHYFMFKQNKVIMFTE